jgi:hypothetical protein
MIGLLTLAASSLSADTPTFTPVGLDTVNVPRLYFFCEATKPGTGLFALDVRFDKEGNRVWIGRTPKEDTRLFQGQVQAAAMDNNAERMLLKLQANASNDEKAEVVLRADGKTVSANFDLTVKHQRYSGYCNKVPTPPERGQ